MSVNREFQLGKPMQGTSNVKGTLIEKYIPRKCEATSKLIGPRDYASVQVIVPNVDSNGRVIVGDEHIIALSGFIRSKGRSEWELEKILIAKGIYPIPEDN